MDYPLKPDQFCRRAGFGVMLVDEIHQDFYSYFRASLYTDVQTMIGLSATLENLDSRQEYFYQLLFPPEQRRRHMDYDRYIHVWAINYLFSDQALRRIRYQNWASGHYSQTELEKSILRNSTILNDYLEMIADITQQYYIDRMQDKDQTERCIIFAGTVAMCGEIRDYLKEKYPNLDIRRYTEEDPYDNIITPQIRITTLSSGGTAVDIENLITAIQTVNVMSVQANKQSLGRLRRLKDKEPIFVYLYCGQIERHLYYHRMRSRMWASLIKSFNEKTYSKRIGG
jgi:superfamily II DNA or RNA helicase